MSTSSFLCSYSCFSISYLSINLISNCIYSITSIRNLLIYSAT
nr:MAG TPA: hypothetical protein [Caudoviricetes sp.]